MLFVLASIERGLHWLHSAPHTAATWARAESQVEQFLDELHGEGAFAGSQPEDSYFVVCDERVNSAQAVSEGKSQLLFGIATAKPGVFHAWMIAYQGGVSRVRTVAVNPRAASRRERGSQ